ncbi:MAG: hypothetical protein GQ583_06770 [Methyloprofundus sp.]|nr:hypothetical protein [Methyloprofundus sp.]
MTTAAIDIDVLDELFENQKKLDDVLNSFFDDDSFLSSSIPVDDNVSGSNSVEDFSLSSDDNILDQKSRNISYLIVPLILEIAAIYYGVTYFT